MEREERVVVIGKAEIDTRKPFKSVKEAVMLFGERVLVEEIYANKLKEMEKPSKQEQKLSHIGPLSAELEEIKKSLQKEKDEGRFLAHCHVSLKQELEEAKIELRKLKERALIYNQGVDPEIEELKFAKTPGRKVNKDKWHSIDGLEYFEKRRSVNFASPLSLIINNKDIGEIPLETTPPKKKRKSKSLIHLFTSLFS